MSGRPGPPASTVGAAQLDRAAERMTSILRWGLAGSLALMAIATGTLVVRSGGDGSDRVFSAPTLAGYLGGNGVVDGLAHGAPEAILTLGIYALVATPLVRVVCGVYYFRLAGDRGLARLATAVLGLLLASLFVLGPLLR